jgi:hypothetical protein
VSVHTDDPELRALFVDEMNRHLGAYTRATDNAAARARALHAMRGAAAMMGLSDVALRLGELEHATRASDAAIPDAPFAELEALLRSAGFEIESLRAFAGRVSSPSVRSRPRKPGLYTRPSDRPSHHTQVL